MATPCVHRNLGSLVGARGFQQNVPEPPRIAALEAKSLAEYPSLVATARVRRIEAVILDLADIEHSLVPLRQIGCHGGCLVSQRSFQCILMQSRREQQRIMGAIEWLPLAKAKRVEWGAGMRFSPLDAPRKRGIQYPAAPDLSLGFAEYWSSAPVRNGAQGGR